MRHDPRSESEEERRFNETLRNLLNTPPKPHGPLEERKRQEPSNGEAARKRKARAEKP